MFTYFSIVQENVISHNYASHYVDPEFWHLLKNIPQAQVKFVMLMMDSSIQFIVSQDNSCA